MNGYWVLLPEDGVVTVKNGDSQPTRIVIRPGLYPTVVYGASHFYPRSWAGFITHDGEITEWNYPSGPVHQVKIQVDKESNRWVSIIGRITQIPLPPCPRMQDDA